MMRTTVGRVEAVGIGQLRGDTCNYIERVAAGETFVVLRRGRVIGRLSAAHGLHAMLIPVPLPQFRSRAGHFVSRVAAGETIAVAYNGLTVAAMAPLDGSAHPGPAAAQTSG